MTAFSIKVPDDLLADLQNHLLATGQSRSAFVRELIERELRHEAGRQVALKEKLMSFAGSAGRNGPRVTLADTGRNADRILREEGYGE